MTREPMLAPTEPIDLDLCKFSNDRIWCIQPKYDGIRVTFENGIPYTRRGKTIANPDIARGLEQLHSASPFARMALDGELLLWNSLTNWWCPFNAIQSVVMSKRALNKVEMDSWVYVVFDVVREGKYLERIQAIQEKFKPFGGSRWMNRFWLAETSFMISREGVESTARLCINMGYEGAIIRDANSPYKHGRVTVREGYLRKYVDWVRDEAVITGCVQLFTNLDTATRRIQNMVAEEAMGALKVRNDKFGAFEIGTGFSAQAREQLWKDHAHGRLIGRTCTFKYRPNHIKNKPCPAVWVGFRNEGE